MGWLRTFFLGDEKFPITVWTIIHVIFGIICWWIGLNLFWTTGAAVGWELIENSSYGMAMFESLGFTITRLCGFVLWQGYNGDSIANSYCDVFAAMVGWGMANWIWG